MTTSQKGLAVRSRDGAVMYHNSRVPIPRYISEFYIVYYQFAYSDYALHA